MGPYHTFLTSRTFDPRFHLLTLPTYLVDTLHPTPARIQAGPTPDGLSESTSSRPEISGLRRPTARRATAARRTPDAPIADSPTLPLDDLAAATMPLVRKPSARRTEVSDFDDSVYLPPRHDRDTYFVSPTPKPTIRPERPENGQPTPRMAWLMAAKRLHDKCRSSPWFAQYYVDGKLVTKDRSILVLLQCTALVLYDTTLAGSSVEASPLHDSDILGFSSKQSIGRISLGAMAGDFLENMLLVDYGLGPDCMPTYFWDRCINGWPLYHEQFRWLCARFADFVAIYGCPSSEHGSLIPPGSAVWKYLASRLRAAAFMSINPADFGLMLYYYHQNHQELEPDEYRAGRTGYTGVLQGMIDELSRVGPDRLQRRLSVDFHEIIPGVVCNLQRRRYLLARVEALAAQYGLPLSAPETESKAPQGVDRLSPPPAKPCGETMLIGTSPHCLRC